MTGLLEYLQTKEKREIIAGDVVRKLAVGVYEVVHGNRTLVCRSTDDLTIGSRVLLTQADSHYVVLRKSGQRSRETVEVIVHG